MAVDYSEWKQWTDKEAAARRSTAPLLIHPRFAEHLRLVAARLEHLTDADSWTAYRAHLETLIDETEAQIRALERQITDGDILGDDLIRQRLQLARLRGRQDGYREALQIPEVVGKTVAAVTQGSPVLHVEP